MSAAQLSELGGEYLLSTGSGLIPRERIGQVLASLAQDLPARPVKASEPMATSESSSRDEPAQPPPIALYHALNDLRNYALSCEALKHIDDQREMFRTMRDNFLRRNDQLASDRANARTRNGDSREDVLRELLTTRDDSSLAPKLEHAEVSKWPRETIVLGQKYCGSAKEALRRGAGAWLDSITHPNTNGQSRSTVLHMKILDAEQMYTGFQLALAMPGISMQAGLSQMKRLKEWFGEMLNELSALLAIRGLSLPSPPGSAVLDAGIGGTDTDWEDIQGLLLAKRDRGEQYTSVRLLGAELKCSDSTIRKAIRKSQTLKGWQARELGPKAAPKAMDLSAVVRDNARQTKELAPDDVLLDDERDAALSQLMDKHPETRAEVNAMSDDDKARTARLWIEQRADSEPSPLEPDKPGGRPRKVQQHKRA